MNASRLKRFIVLLSAGIVLSAQSWGAEREMSEQELSDVNAQGLMTLDNTSLNGLNFSTITFNADIEINANFRNLQLGTYTRNGSAGSDQDVPLWEFGRTDGTADQRTVKIQNPYLQIVYNPAGGAGNNQIVGFRFGFNGMTGDTGLQMNNVSGNVWATPSLAGISLGLLGQSGFDGARQTTSCGQGLASIICLPLSVIGGIRTGNASGPTRDFWMSYLSQAVQFPAQPGMSLPAIAQSGVWLNWTDRLTAYNILTGPPANTLAMLRPH